MRRNGQISTSGPIFNPKFEIPWAVSYSNTNFGGASAKICTCFEQKTAFVMQNFQNLGAGGGGGDHFLTKPPKGTSLADLIHAF